MDGSLATIDSIAVLPDWQGRGVASALLCEATNQLGSGVELLDAWTREDAAANAWYLAHGFVAESHYLHVYTSWDDPLAAEFEAPEGLSVVGAFMHAALEDEAEMRRRFRRVHVCRRYVRPVS